MRVTNSTLSRIQGSIFGMAYGDALASPAEFMQVDAIKAKWGPGGPSVPRVTNNVYQVTDDTQMALAVGEALMGVGNGGVLSIPGSLVSGGLLSELLAEGFVKWSRSPDNNRAPGGTCMTACHRLEQGLPWREATVPTSKGCGANMRATPVGLLLGETQDTRSGIAQLQAGITHGHPTGLAAADLTAYTTTLLATGEAEDETGTLSGMALLSRLRDYADENRVNYRQPWLGDLWRVNGAADPASYMRYGWDECLEVLARVEAAYHKQDKKTDPCLQTGLGWIAEECWGTALLCFLLFPRDPHVAMRRATVTVGDSDSIACLTGAFAGAANGLRAMPPWAAKIEYTDRLAMLAAFLADNSNALRNKGDF